MSEKVRILSIDGGGMRGIIPATILKYVEEQLRKKTENENARIADYFDMIVGTSTGGILTCFYLTPNSDKEEGSPTSKYPAEKALEFYVDMGYKIFNESKKNAWLGFRQLFNAVRYRPHNIEQIFKEKFDDLKMKDLLKPSIVTTYDINEKTSVFFNSREPKEERNYFVRDVVRSTSAAPTYFPPAIFTNTETNLDMINIDGGVFANNPAMCAYAECRKTSFNNKKPPKAIDMLILSLGTGGGQFELKKLDKVNKWGVIKWAKATPEIMMDGSLDTVHHQMKNLFETLEEEDVFNYLRINVPENDRNYSSDMADASKENIEKLQIAANKTLEAANEKKEDAHTLDEFIDLII